MKTHQLLMEGVATDEGVGRALDAAAALVGGRAKLADALGVRRSAIGNWKTRGVPIEYCPRIESLAGKRITRRDLRPGDFMKIWPELADMGERLAGPAGGGAVRPRPDAVNPFPDLDRRAPAGEGA